MAEPRSLRRFANRLREDLGLRRHHGVEGRPDGGEIEGDHGGRPARQLAEGKAGGAQIPLSGLGQAVIGRQPIQHVLQRCQGGCWGDGVVFHGLDLCVLGLTPADWDCLGLTFGTTITE